MKAYLTLPVLGIHILNVCILLIGILWALYVNSAHVFMRTGALLVAVTGLYVVGQVYFEIKMERSQKQPQPLRNAEEGVSTIKRVADNLKLMYLHRQTSQLHEVRLYLVGSIAIWLCIGELIHGFAELLQ